MFLVSFRLTGKKVLTALLAVVLVVALCATGAKVFGKKSVETAGPEAVTPVNESKGNKNNSAKSNDDRIAFLQGYGWELEEEPAEVMEVIIPKEFDEVYTAYNSIQMTQGYDLSKYGGKRVKRYSYVVTNYPGGEGEIRANLLVYKNKVIGGDVCSMELDGFMHGFEQA